MFKQLYYRVRNFASDPRFSEIFTGSIWALSARVISAFLGLSITVIIARWYGAGVLGIVSVINSFLLLATIFTLLGTNNSILRLIPEYIVKYSVTSAFRLYRKTQYMVIGVSFIFGILFFVFSDFIAEKLFNKPHMSFFFGFASIFIVFKALMLFNTNAVRALRLIKTFAFMQTFPQIANVVLLFCLGFFSSSKNIPVYALLGGYAITGVFGWTIMENAFKKRDETNRNLKYISIREILSLSLPMLMTATMTFIIGQTGVLMLGMFRPDEEVGYYSTAVKLATMTTFIFAAINSMAAPKFSELYHSDQKDELFYLAKKSAKLVFWTTAPILIGLLVIGKPILKFVFAPDFVFAYPAMVLLVIGEFANSISGATAFFMNMTGNHIALRNIMSLAAILNLGINLLLTPRFGLYGAAFAGMITLSGWNIAVLFFIKRKFGKTTGYFPGINFNLIF